MFEFLIRLIFCSHDYDLCGFEIYDDNSRRKVEICSKCQRRKYSRKYYP